MTDTDKVVKRAKKDIKNMRAWLDEAERHLKKGQLYGAYTVFGMLRGCAFHAASGLSRSTLKAAMDWGHAVSMRDKNDKHEGFAFLDDF